MPPYTRVASRPNHTNFRSADTHVLDMPEMQSIRSTVMDRVYQFAWKVISAHPKHAFYITQSWVNFTKPGQSHYRHMHTNSLISGVLYVQTKREVDRIDFYRVSTAQIFVSFDHVNNFNALSMSYIPNVGDLILFPSALMHGVGPTTGTHTRISLAFNALAVATMTLPICPHAGELAGPALGFSPAGTQAQQGPEG